MATSHTSPSRGWRHSFSDQSRTLAIDYLRVIGSKKATTIADHLSSGRDRDAIEVTIDPSEYHCPEEFGRDYAAVELVSKLPCLALGENLAANAIESFNVNESVCKTTNKELSSRLSRRSSIDLPAHSYIHTAAKIISDTLGNFSWDKAESYFAFSGGASTRLPRRSGDPYFKFGSFSERPHVTPNAFELAITAIKRVPLWEKHLSCMYGPDPRSWVKLVIGSRIDTVAKNAKTDRVIAIEPDLNMFLQKGIGCLIRKALGRHGLLSKCAKEINNELARQGSLSGDLCTIDLKAASDTVSTELCRILLPDEWFFALMATRSERGVLPNGDVVAFEKVSSMGNGFTFELETLIFWALARSVSVLHGAPAHQLQVFGDDIITLGTVYEPLVWLLDICGFTVNEKKSFYKGHFRESCGKHYFSGADVTPLYIRKPIKTQARLIWLANSVRRYAGRRGCDSIADPTYFSLWEGIVNQVHPRLRHNRIPDGIGDGGLIGCFDEATPQYSIKRGSFVVEHLTESKPKIEAKDTAGELRWFMYTEVKGSSFSSSFDDQELVGSTRLSTGFVERWRDPPSWGARFGGHMTE